jgi:DNA-directed RNA polymerase specialized sigma24 family protein
MAKKYRVTLTPEEREALTTLIQKGVVGVRKLKRAHILLLVDEGESDEAIAEALHSSLATVQRTRQRFVEEGFEAALHEASSIREKAAVTGTDGSLFSGLSL